MLFLGLYTGCKLGIGAPGLPEERPQDLVVRYYDGGGMMPESEEYYICADSVVYASFYQNQRNHWIAKPTAAQMDTLYGLLLKQDAINIRSRDEGEVFDRGGISVNIGYGTNDFHLVDAGSMFVEEDDMDRWRALTTGLVEWCSRAFSTQRIQCQFDLLLADSLAPNSLHINLSRHQLASWRPVDNTPLPKRLPVSLLPGNYLLEVSASIEASSYSLQEPIIIESGHHNYQILLEKDTFELQQR